jgi:phospholipid transport system substrate-binding protein
LRVIDCLWELRPGNDGEDKALLSLRTILAAVGLMAVSLAVPMAPAVAVPDARVLIQALGDDGTKMLSDTKLSAADREREFRRLLQTNFDIDGMAKFAIGRYGRQLTDAQWQTYRGVFEDFIVKVYSTHLGHRTWATFTVTDVRSADDGGNLVVSETTMPGHQPTKLIWHVHDTDHGPKIIDIAVEGISMAATQRQEFGSVIQNGNGNIDGFLTQLRQKASDLQ